MREIACVSGHDKIKASGLRARYLHVILEIVTR